MNSTELFVARDEIKEQIDLLRGELKDIEQQIKDMFYEQARDALRADGKDFGTTNIFEEGMKIKCVFKKNVVWDTQALEDISSRLGSELSQHYIDKKLTIRESRYKEAPPELIEMFSTARTVSTSGVIIEVDKEEVQ